MTSARLHCMFCWNLKVRHDFFLFLLEKTWLKIRRKDLCFIKLLCKRTVTNRELWFVMILALNRSFNHNIFPSSLNFLQCIKQCYHLWCWALKNQNCKELSFSTGIFLTVVGLVAGGKVSNFVSHQKNNTEIKFKKSFYKYTNFAVFHTQRLLVWNIFIVRC